MSLLSSAQLKMGNEMKPKCSLLVLTYNQEDFVAEAVKAALAQTYSPVEIIISDDASSDRTFSIAKNCVKDYDGPHEIVLNRNKQNMGVIAHTNALVARATGDILIPAYGDDVSYPDRVESIVACFEAEGPLLVHSYADPIDGSGNPTLSRYLKADFFRTTDALEVATSLAHYLGASGAWSRALFDTYGPIQSPLVFDDHILGFRAALECRVSLIRKPLLAYRDGLGLSHSKKNGLDSERNRQQRRRLLRQALAVFEERQKDARLFGLSSNDPISRKLMAALDSTETRLAYYDGGVINALSKHPLGAGRDLIKEVLRDLRNR
ncbi:glycosyltransferase [Roseovarius bejariae]|nr:glycosyltransferase [Roseovarius bejariae]